MKINLKKLLCLALALVMLVGAVPGVTFAADVPTAEKTASVGGEEDAGTAQNPVLVNIGDEIEYAITVNNPETAATVESTQYDIVFVLNWSNAMTDGYYEDVIGTMKESDYARVRAKESVLYATQQVFANYPGSRVAVMGLLSTLTNFDQRNLLDLHIDTPFVGPEDYYSTIANGALYARTPDLGNYGTNDNARNLDAAIEKMLGNYTDFGGGYKAQTKTVKARDDQSRTPVIVDISNFMMEDVMTGSMTPIWNYWSVSMKREADRFAEAFDDGILLSVRAENTPCVNGKFNTLEYDGYMNTFLMAPGQGRWGWVKFQAGQGQAAQNELLWQLINDKLPFTQAATITDVLPAGLEYVSSTGGDSVDVSGQKVTWSLSDLPAGEEATVTVTAKVKDLGTFKNQATVDILGYDTITTNETYHAALEQSAKPGIDQPTAGDRMVTGTGEPGAEIVVTFLGGATESTQVEQDGSWSVTVPAGSELKENDKIEAVQKESNKKPSEPAEAIVGPGKTTGNPSQPPRIAAVYDTDTKVEGWGIPGSEIMVTFQNGATASATVNADTTWSVRVPAGVTLVAGEYVSATQTEAGKDKSGPYTVQIGTAGQSKAPVINTVYVDDTTITGEGIPGSTINVTFQNGATATATVADDYTWRVAKPAGVTLVAGEKVKAAQTEVGKPVSPEASTTIVDGTRPDPSRTPIINTITAGDRVVTGKGISGSAIRVFFPDGSVVSTTVASNNTWTVNVPNGVNLVVGDWVTAKQTEVGKSESQPYSVQVGAAGISATPEINTVYENAVEITGQGIAGSEIKVTFDKFGVTVEGITVNSNGKWSASVPNAVTLTEGDLISATQTEVGKPESAKATIRVTKLPVNSQKSDKPEINTVYESSDKITGTGIDGAGIKVTFKNGATATGTVNGTTWEVKVPAGMTLTEGDIVRATQIESGKTESDPAATSVLKDGTVPSEKPVVNPVTAGDDEITGTGVPGSTIDVIFPDGKTGTATVDDKGNWSVDVPSGVDLEAGGEITVTQTEPGPGKGPSDPVIVIIDPPTVKSEIPTVDPVTAGDKTVTGTGVPGSTINVTFPGVGTPVEATVDGAGNWSVDVPGGVDLKAGEEITVTQTEPDPGKVPSDNVIVTVGENPSNQPVVNPVNPGDSTITGTGEPGATIDIIFPDGKTSTGTVDGDRNWSVDVPSGVDLNPGDKVTITQTEPGKDKSDPVVVTVRDISATPTIADVFPYFKEISGTGVSGATINVTFYNNDRTVTKGTGTATVSNGVWTLALPSDVTLAVDDVIIAVQTESGKAPSDEEETKVKDPFEDHYKYISGYPDGTVKPDNEITRAEVAMIYFRLVNDPNKDEPVGTQFLDVPDGKWFTQAVNYLAKHGIITGYTDMTYQPDNPITRAELVALAARFEGELISLPSSAFPDVAEDHWAVRYTNHGFASGWIVGRDGVNFFPEENITRAETTRLTNALCKRNPTIETLLEPYNVPGDASLFPDLVYSDPISWYYVDMVEAAQGHEYYKDGQGIENWTQILP